MTRIISLRSASLTMVAALMALCWFTLGCGLLAGDQPTTGPTSDEPDVQATIDAAVGSIEATRQAGTPTAATATAEPKPTATTAPTETAATSAGDLVGAFSELGPDARWGDVLPAFTEPEQDCIRGELGKAQLAVALEGLVFHEGSAQEWDSAMFDCLSQETAAALFRGLFIAQMVPLAQLTEENDACIQDLLADTDAVALMAGTRTDATPEQAEALMGFFFGLAPCVPEIAAGPALQHETALWGFSTEGWVNAAPTVSDGVVYVASDDHRVYALHAAIGSELWSFATGDAIQSTPTVVGDVVYVGSNDNRLYALDAVSGVMLWSYDTGVRVQHSPVVSGVRLYTSTLVNDELRVAALDISSGALLWTAQVPHTFDPEFAPTVAGDLVYVPGAEYGVFHALNSATGEVAWTASVGGYVESGPTVLDGVVYLTVVNEAYALDEMTGEVIWSYGTERFPARDFPALVVDGVYYLSPDDFLHALDAATGELLWTYQARGPISAAPVAAGGVVFGATEDGHIFAVDAVTGAELWTLAAEGGGLQGLTVANGVLYVESDLGILMAVDAADGQVVEEYEKGYITGLSNYAVHEGVLYFGSFPNRVYAHTAPQPR